MTLARRSAWAVLAACVSMVAPAAQTRPGPSPEQYSRLHWRTIGPEGNRFSAAAGIAGDPLTYYVGAASGGIWKTTDGGTNWTPIFDDAAGAVDRRARRRAVGSEHRLGRHRRRQDPQPHLARPGRLPSLDAGKTWTLMGLEQTGRIPRLVDPSEGSRRRSWSARSATPTGRSRSAASSARPTAARPGRRRSSSTRTPAARTSRWIRRTRASSSPACGRSRSTPGAATAADRAAACSPRATAA